MDRREYLKTKRRQLEELLREEGASVGAPLFCELSSILWEMGARDSLEWAERAVELQGGEGILQWRQMLYASGLFRLGSPYFRHPASVLGVWLSESGLWSFSRDGSFWEWTLQGQRKRQVRWLQDGTPCCVAWKEKCALIGTEEGELFWFDFAQGRLHKREKAHGEAVTYLLSMPEGWLSADEAGKVIVWSREGSRSLTFERHTLSLSALAASQDGTLVASGDVGGEVFLWLRNSAKVGKKLELGLEVTSLAFSPNKRRLLVGTEEGELSLWDAALGKKEQAWKIHDDAITQIVWTEPEHCWTSSNDGRLCQVSLPDGEKKRSLGPVNGELHFLALTEEWVAAGGDETVLHLWSRSKSRELLPPFGPSKSLVGMAAHGFVATVYGDSQCHVWNPATGTPVCRLSWPEMKATAVALSPSSDLVAVGDELGRLFLWHFLDGSLYVHWQDEHEGPIRCLCFSEDGSLLASADEAGVVCLWDVEGRTVKIGGNLGLGPISALAFFPLGDCMVVGTEEVCLVVDLERAEDCAQFDRHRGPVHTIAAAWEGVVVTAGRGKEVWIWDGTTGEPKGSLVDQEEVQGIVLLDEHTLLTINSASQLTVWDLKGGKKRKSYFLEAPPSHIAVLPMEGEALVGLSSGVIRRFPPVLLY